ncbi:MAG: DUF3179 domain-containing protein [Candidatus Hadarchaeaceae archaeon]
MKKVMIYGAVLAGAVFLVSWGLFLNTKPYRGTNFPECETPTSPGWKTNFEEYIVSPSEFLSGGPRKDGIPAIHSPKFVTVGAASDFLSDDEMVLGLVYNGDVKAYPIQIMVWHEIVNDVVGGDPLLITWCPLCGTGIAFDRVIDGQAYCFGVSGMLYNSDLVMYDHQTESWWPQVLGTALVGDMAGTKLNPIPITITSWGSWKNLHPDTQVLSRDTGYSRPYGDNPYPGYEQSESIWFPVSNTDNRLFAKDIVTGLTIDGSSKAYPHEELAKMVIVNDEVGGQSVVVIWNPNLEDANVFSRTIDGRALNFEYDNINKTMLDNETGSSWSLGGRATVGQMAGKQLDQIIAIRSYWFAWVAFYPGTEILL